MTAGFARSLACTLGLFCLSPFAATVFGDAALVSRAEPTDPEAAQNAAANNLEQLTQIEVTSVARKDQQLQSVGAAVYVITAEEIQRSGATSIPELLRGVPGLQVAQISANVWAVSARGFNGRAANKILVLVDGRSVYNNLFSGTFWDQNQIPVDEIERIEVVRGPGATMWGANAVNGVISIITKKARDTQGLRVSTEISQNALPQSTVIYGGHHGDDLQFRLDADFSRNLGFLNADGSGAWDRWHYNEQGGRLDWRASDRDAVTLDGQVYESAGNQQINPVWPLPSDQVTVRPFDSRGGFIRSRWERQLKASDLALQFSYTNEGRAELVSHGTLHTIDLDFEHHIALSRRNDFNWGGEYRLRHDNIIGIVNSPVLGESLLSAFAQDELAIVPSRLSLTAGLKLQEFLAPSHAHLELQPQVRLLWTPSKRNTFWAATSRAVREPSLIDRDAEFTFTLPPVNGFPAAGVLLGNSALDAEVLTAYEAGSRHQFGKKWSLDLSAFYNRYKRLIQTVNLAPYVEFYPSPRVVVPETDVATGAADTRGVEVAASFAPLRKWHTRLGWSWLTASFASQPALNVTQPPGSIWATPKSTWFAISSWDVHRHWNLDLSLYGASQIVEQSVPGYVRVDLRLARKFGEYGEIGAGIENLTDDRHLEFRGEDYLGSSYIRRNVFVRISWRF